MSFNSISSASWSSFGFHGQRLLRLCPFFDFNMIQMVYTFDPSIPILTEASAARSWVTRSLATLFAGFF